MLTHVVFMQFKPDVDAKTIDALEKQLDQLPNRIIEIQTYEFGRDVLRTERSYDFALVANFANAEALKRYQQHPDHLAVVEQIKAMVQDIRTVDFYGTDAGDFKDVGPGAEALGVDF
jgi:hypothetical protein